MRSKIINAVNTFRNGQYAAWKRYRELKPLLKMPKGTFIEAGANDGITQSNTYGLEKWSGWNGLLIEPLPSKMKMCKSARKHSSVLPYALVDYDFPGRELELVDCNLMSFVKGSLKDVNENEYAGNIAATQKIRTDSINVPVSTLDEAIKISGIESFDLVSLDVEGYELNILNGFDIERYKPTYFLIEHGGRPEIVNKLSNYRAIKVLGNEDVLYERR